MRALLALFLGLMLGSASWAAAIPAGARSHGPSAARPAPANDLARLLGTWECTGDAAGSRSTEIYMRVDDEAIALGNAVHTSTGAQGAVSETFRFDPKSRNWTLTALRNQFFDALSATGSLWASAGRWILTGNETFRGKPMAVRLVYTQLGADRFRREHQVQSSGTWRDDAAYVCRRTSVPAVAAAPSVAVPPNIAAPPTSLPVAAATPSVAPRVRPRATFVPAVGVVSAPSPTALSRVAQAAPTPWRFSPWRFGTTPAATPVPAPKATPTPAPETAATPIALPRVAASQQRVAFAEPGTPAPRRTAAPKRTPASPTPAPKRTLLPRRAAAPAPDAAAKPRTAQRTAPPKHVAATHHAAPLEHAAAASHDRAYALLGTWACRTTDGQASTHTYSRAGNDAIDLRNLLTIAGRHYTLDETYRFDPAHGDWSNVQAGGAYRGTAPPWTGSAWTFDGVESEGRAADVHMTYTRLGSSTFRREFARLQGNAWKSYLSETCNRA